MKSKNKKQKQKFTKSPLRDDVSSLYDRLGENAADAYRDFPIHDLPHQKATTSADHSPESSEAVQTGALDRIAPSVESVVPRVEHDENLQRVSPRDERTLDISSVRPSLSTDKLSEQATDPGLARAQHLPPSPRDLRSFSGQGEPGVSQSGAPEFGNRPLSRHSSVLPNSAQAPGYPVPSLANRPMAYPQDAGQVRGGGSRGDYWQSGPEPSVRGGQQGRHRSHPDHPYQTGQYPGLPEGGHPGHAYAPRRSASSAQHAGTLGYSGSAQQSSRRGIGAGQVRPEYQVPNRDYGRGHPVVPPEHARSGQEQSAQSLPAAYPSLPSKYAAHMPEQGLGRPGYAPHGYGRATQHITNPEQYPDAAASFEQPETWQQAPEYSPKQGYPLHVTHPDYAYQAAQSRHQRESYPGPRGYARFEQGGPEYVDETGYPPSGSPAYYSAARDQERGLSGYPDPGYQNQQATGGHHQLQPYPRGRDYEAARQGHAAAGYRPSRGEYPAGSSAIPRHHNDDGIANDGYQEYRQPAELDRGLSPLQEVSRYDGPRQRVPGAEYQQGPNYRVDRQSKGVPGTGRYESTNHVYPEREGYESSDYSRRLEPEQSQHFHEEQQYLPEQQQFEEISNYTQPDQYNDPPNSRQFPRETYHPANPRQYAVNPDGVVDAHGVPRQSRAQILPAPNYLAKPINAENAQEKEPAKFAWPESMVSAEEQERENAGQDYLHSTRSTRQNSEHVPPMSGDQHGSNEEPLQTSGHSRARIGKPVKLSVYQTATQQAPSIGTSRTDTTSTNRVAGSDTNPRENTSGSSNAKEVTTQAGQGLSSNSTSELTQQVSEDLYGEKSRTGRTDESQEPNRLNKLDKKNSRRSIRRYRRAR